MQIGRGDSDEAIWLGGLFVCAAEELVSISGNIGNYLLESVCGLRCDILKAEAVQETEVEVLFPS
jgi:hypothetical protein